MIKIQPILHRILVKPVQVEEIDEVRKSASAAGLYVPKVGNERFARSGVDQGHVVAFGETVFRDFKIDNPLKIGDKVTYAKHSGKWVTDPNDPSNDEAEMIIINDEDVIAIFQEDTQ